jgi:hypothetical protein
MTLTLDDLTTQAQNKIIECYSNFSSQEQVANDPQRAQQAIKDLCIYLQAMTKFAEYIEFSSPYHKDALVTDASYSPYYNTTKEMLSAMLEVSPFDDCINDALICADHVISYKHHCDWFNKEN